MNRATQVPRVAGTQKSSNAVTAWVCANPTNKAHPRIFTLYRDSAISHAKHWRCKMYKVRVLAVAELIWIPPVGVQEIEINPAATPGVL